MVSDGVLNFFADADGVHHLQEIPIIVIKSVLNIFEHPGRLL